MIRSAIVCAVLAAGLATSASAATVVFQDDFESDSVGPQAVLNNWTVGGSIEVIGSGFYPMYDGSDMLDMNGTSPGSITHAFANLAAGVYTLTFNYGNNTGSNGVEQLSFSLGSFASLINIPGAILNMNSVSYTFSWAGGATNLFFADTGTSSFDSGGPILDNVMLTTVPLPAGAPLLLAGLAGLAALRRRKAA